MDNLKERFIIEHLPFLENGTFHLVTRDGRTVTDVRPDKKQHTFLARVQGTDGPVEYLESGRIRTAGKPQLRKNASDWDLFIELPRPLTQLEDVLHAWLFGDAARFNVHHVDTALGCAKIVRKMVKEETAAPAAGRPSSKDGKFVYPDCLYARANNNKTLDVSYVPQAVDAVEYVRRDIAKQE